MAGENGSGKENKQGDVLAIEKLLDTMQKQHLDKNVRAEIHAADGRIQFWVTMPGSQYDQGPQVAGSRVRHVGE